MYDDWEWETAPDFMRRRMKIYFGIMRDKNRHLRMHTIYDKFELLLPHKCKIDRNNNTVIVKHSYFRLRITPAFTGFGEVLPKGFEKRYMKCKSKVRSYEVWIGIELQFTWKAMLMNKEQYYGWIDEYIEDLNKYASFKYFKEMIQWDMTNAIMSCLIGR
jgi:hypothetical protein